MKEFKVLVLRPYPERIREKVFAAINAAGGLISEDYIIPAGTADVELQGLVADKHPDVVLAPFHPHTDNVGKEVNGWSALKALPQFFHGTVPVLMPVSLIGMHSYMDLYKHSEIENKDRVLVLEQVHIDSNELSTMIAQHLSS